MKKVIGLIAVALGAVCLVGAVADPAARGKQPSAHQSTSAVVLGQGKTRQLSWRISAVQSKQGGSRKPCLVEQIRIFGGYSQGAECGPPAPPSDNALFTQFSATFDRADGQRVGATSLGFAFSLDVRRVSFDLVPGPSQIRRTRLLTSAQAEKTKLAPFRYLAFGVAREVCVEGITGFDQAGAKIFEQRQSCKKKPTHVIPSRE